MRSEIRVHVTPYDCGCLWRPLGQELFQLNLPLVRNSATYAVTNTGLFLSSLLLIEILRYLAQVN